VIEPGPYESPGHAQGRRAISGPLTLATRGLSRSLTDSSPCRSGHVTGPDGTDSQADSAGSIPVTRSKRERAASAVLFEYGPVVITRTPHRLVPVACPMGDARPRPACDLDQAVHHGLTAFSYDRKTEASLLSRAADLNRILTERYPNERLTSDFRERCIEARTNLRRRAHARA